MSDIVDSPNIFPVRHILVPYDESSYAIHALRTGLELAKKNQSHLTVLSIKYNDLLGSSFITMTSDHSKIEQDRIKKFNENFNLLDKYAKKLNIVMEYKIIFSTSASESILSYASSNDVDLIVMGSRGRGHISLNMRVGSVSVNVILNSKCPVMVVK